MNYKKALTILIITLLACLSALYMYKFYAKSKQYKNVSKKLVESSLIESKQAFEKYRGILIKDKNDFDLLLNGSDDVSYAVFISHEWERPVQNAIKQIVKPRDKVLILGGHIGCHALLISKLAGSEGKVSIFEANSNTLKFLRANLSLNNVQNATVYPKAAFSRNTLIPFLSIAKGNTGASHIARDENSKPEDGYISVEAVSIDSLPEIDTIDVLQMDIEGAEAEAVYGAQKLIDNSPNLVVIQEYSPFWIKDIDSYLKFWRSRGYSIAQITEAGLLEMTDEQLKTCGQIDVVMSRNLAKLISDFHPSK